MDDFNTFDMFCDGSDLQFVEADDYWDKLLVDDWIYASVCCSDCMMQQTYATTILMIRDLTLKLLYKRQRLAMVIL
jgi:hypothetical protein